MPQKRNTRIEVDTRYWYWCMTSKIKKETKALLESMSGRLAAFPITLENIDTEYRSGLLTIYCKINESHISNKLRKSIADWFRETINDHNIAIENFWVRITTEHYFPAGYADNVGDLPEIEGISQLCVEESISMLVNTELKQER